MATAKKNTELAPVENFALTTAYDGLDPELAAELKDQMDDLDDESGINCRTIKIPSGGNLAFTVQGDEEGDEEYLKDIEGVIVFTHRMNGYCRTLSEPAPTRRTRFPFAPAWTASPA